MKKKLSPLWFLKDPLDSEQKEYILLDYLKSASKGLNSDTCFSILKDISRLVKSLNLYKENGMTKWDPIYQYLTKSEKSFFEKFSAKKITKEEKDSLDTIVEQSLETLYGYSEICLEMLKEEESKIKIFKIQSKFESHSKEEGSGILIIRNMITDKLLNYFFKANIKIKTGEKSKEMIMMKKIHLKNPFFSLSYEYIYHEILEEFNPNSGHFPSLYVIEIYENFDEESEIYKLSKERFIEEINKLQSP
jgi:hypothetical protein